ncbi:MAG TPA: DUF2784 domain-containing protein [Candidatus Binataceae bacterium]|nr:DUF2784 domain-containing protein [Candidatus Binataceae bacterium]
MSPSLYLSNLILVFHFSYAAFIVLGLILIAIGGFVHWNWIRNPWLRFAHLSAILVPLAETLLGIECPLTRIENLFRVRAGEVGYPDTFVGYWLHRILFHDWPPQVFAALYAGVALLTLAMLWFAPPRWRPAREQRAQWLEAARLPGRGRQS